MDWIYIKSKTIFPKIFINDTTKGETNESMNISMVRAFHPKNNCILHCLGNTIQRRYLIFIVRPWIINFFEAQIRMRRCFPNLVLSIGSCVVGSGKMPLYLRYGFPQVQWKFPLYPRFSTSYPLHKNHHIFSPTNQ